jgi:chloride channel protein, CIC family
MRWLTDLITERAHEWIAPNLRFFLRTRQPTVWALSIAVGIAAAFAAILFRLAIGAFQLPWIGTMSEHVASAAREVPWWTVLLAPAVGGLLVGLIIHFLIPGRRVEGVADVIEARHFPSRRIGLRVGLGSAFVSALSLGSGASAGREGPVVHLGATIATILGKQFTLPPQAHRILLASGVAAAISASFNAPIAGVLFAHEVILGHYAPSAFVPIVIASVLAAVISRLWFGNYPAFIVSDYQITSYWEVPAFMLLGITCAVVAILFQFALMGTDRVARRIDVPLWIRPVVGGLMVGTIALAFPEVLGVGYEATDQALQQQLPLMLMLALIVAKTAATAITLASRFGGGIFSPALYLGAMTGGAFGIIAAGVFPDMASSHGLYAILGMGAVAGAVLGAPISTTVMVFELTGGYAVTMALLLTVSIANGLTQAVHGKSYFHWQLETRGLFLQEGPHKRIVRHLRVADFMCQAKPEESVVPFDSASNPWLTPDDTLEAALRHFDETEETWIAVVAADDTQKLVGWAHQTDALDRFAKEMIAANVEEHR